MSGKVIVETEDVHLGSIRAVADINIDDQFDSVIVERRTLDALGAPAWVREASFSWSETVRERAIVFALLKKLSGISLVLLLAACAVEEPPPEAPAVHLIAANGPPLDAFLEGAQAWSALGFEASFESAGLPECFPRWWDGDERCQITIGIVIDPLLVAREGVDAKANRRERRVTIDARLSGEQLVIAVAHEVGHVLLDASDEEHTPTGIMSGQTAVMSDDDRDLACRNVNICIGGRS